jgi:hypothetical protein
MTAIQMGWALEQSQSQHYNDSAQQSCAILGILGEEVGHNRGVCAASL